VAANDSNKMQPPARFTSPIQRGKNRCWRKSLQSIGRVKLVS